MELKIIHKYGYDGKGNRRKLTEKEKAYIIEWAKDLHPDAARLNHPIPFGTVANSCWQIFPDGRVTWR